MPHGRALFVIASHYHMLYYYICDRKIGESGGPAKRHAKHIGQAGDSLQFDQFKGYPFFELRAATIRKPLLGTVAKACLVSEMIDTHRINQRDFHLLQPRVRTKSNTERRRPRSPGSRGMGVLRQHHAGKPPGKIPESYRTKPIVQGARNYARGIGVPHGIAMEALRSYLEQEISVVIGCDNTDTQRQRLENEILLVEAELLNRHIQRHWFDDNAREALWTLVSNLLRKSATSPNEDFEGPSATLTTAAKRACLCEIAYWWLDCQFLRSKEALQTSPVASATPSHRPLVSLLSRTGITATKE